MLAWVLLFFPMVVAKQSTGLEARSGARSGRVSQGAGAWPAVGTAPTLTDLSCERAPRQIRILMLANLTTRGLFAVAHYFCTSIFFGSLCRRLKHLIYKSIHLSIDDCNEEHSICLMILLLTIYADFKLIRSKYVNCILLHS